MITSIDEAKSLVQKVKNKVMAIIGEFLKNGEKLEFMEETTKRLKIADKDKILERINYLKAKQEELLSKSKGFTDKIDKLTLELGKYKGIDIKKAISILGFRSIEVLKNLISQAVSLAKEGEQLISEINTQNKNVSNLEQYIEKSTREGFKFELPKLEQITKPISEVFKPIMYTAIAIGGILLIRELKLWKR